MINTTLCYIIKDGKVLMLFRNKKENDLNEGKWVGVGGKFLPGETPEQCLLREVQEETGLTLTGYRFCGIIRFVSDVWEDEDMYLYAGEAFTGELQECSEGTLAWIPAEEVLQLPLWAGDRYFLEPLLAGEPEINLTVVYRGDELAAVTDEAGRDLRKA